MDAFLQLPGQEEGGGPDNLEKDNFPVSDTPGQSFRKPMLFPRASTAFVLTPLELPATGSQTDEGQRGGGLRRWNKVESGGRMLRWEKRKEGGLETSDALTIASLCRGFEDFSHRPTLYTMGTGDQCCGCGSGSGGHQMGAVASYTESDGNRQFIREKNTSVQGKMAEGAILDLVAMRIPNGSFPRYPLSPTLVCHRLFLS